MMKRGPKHPGGILLLPQAMCGDNYDDPGRNLAQAPHLVLRISSAFVRHFMKVFGETPAPWPLVPNFGDDDVYEGRQDVSLQSWLEVEAHAAFLRSYCDGGRFYYCRCVLLNPLSEYLRVESQLAAIVESPFRLQHARDILQVASAIGWCGVDLGEEGWLWLLVFAPQHRARLQALKGTLAERQIEWWVIDDRREEKAGVWLLPEDLPRDDREPTR